MSASATATLVLGVDVEELYILLAEGIQVANNGLPAGTFEGAERKAERSRATLLLAGIPSAVIEEFEDAVATLRPSQPGRPTESFVRETIAASERLGDVMSDIRDRLHPSAGKAFDVGVMAARLHLCLRATRSDGPVKMQQIYLTELQRTAPILLTMLQAVTADPGLRFPEAPIREDLRRLEVTLERFDLGAEWRQQALKRTDALFSDIGFSASGPLPVAAAPQAVPDEEEALVDQLIGYREILMQIAEDGDAATAEKGQRILIEDARRTLEPDHPVTLAVRSDLALSVLAQERADLALDLALDVAHDAEEWLGPEKLATAAAQYVALMVMMATRELDECLRYFEDKLRWLAEEDPGMLDEEMADLQSKLLDLVGG